MLVKCTNPNCNNEQEYSENNKYCTMCGTILPCPTKKCISITCNKQLPLDAKFCSSCGTKQEISSNVESALDSTFHMGNDNNIAGDINVVGKKEETHIEGNATIIKNEDETKQVKTCHICGENKIILEVHNCPKCGKFTCKNCFNQEYLVCNKCIEKEKTIKGYNSFFPEKEEVEFVKAIDEFLCKREIPKVFNLNDLLIEGVVLPYETMYTKNDEGEELLLYKRDINGNQMLDPNGQVDIRNLARFKLKAIQYNNSLMKSPSQKNELKYQQRLLENDIDDKVKHLKNKAEKKYTTEPGSMSRNEYRLKTGIHLRPGEKVPAIRDEEAIKKAHEGIEAAAVTRRKKIHDIVEFFIDTDK